MPTTRQPAGIKKARRYFEDRDAKVTTITVVQAYKPNSGWGPWMSDPTELTDDYLAGLTRQGVTYVTVRNEWTGRTADFTTAELQR